MELFLSWTTLYVPFILILNIHFKKYYAPLRAYAREPPFNHLDSASFGINSISYAHNWHFYSHFSR